MSFEKKTDVSVGWLYFVFHAFLSFSFFFLFQLVCFGLDWFFEDQISGPLKITDPLDLRARTAVLWLCRRGHFHPMNFWWKKTEGQKFAWKTIGISRGFRKEFISSL